MKSQEQKKLKNLNLMHCKFKHKKAKFLINFAKEELSLYFQVTLLLFIKLDLVFLQHRTNDNRLALWLIL